MYFEVHATGIVERAQAPDIAMLYRSYLAACRNGNMPRQADFDVPELPQFAAFLMRLEPVGDGVFRYSYYGSGITAVAQFDITGQTTADFEGPLRAFFERAYAQCIETGQPLFTIHRAIKANLVHTWERLLLPVRMADGAVAFIVYNRPREFEQDFLQAILNGLPDGLIAFRATREANGELSGAVVLSANPAACDMFQIENIEGQQLRTALPLLHDSAVWEALVRVISTRSRELVEVCHQHQGTPRYLRFQITPLFDGAMMHIADVTALTLANIVLEREHEQLRSEISRQQSEGDVLRGLAHSDALTGALNRRGLFAAADEWSRKRDACSVIAVDIDSFKLINDRYGHGVGDNAIREIASVLMDVANQHDGFVARLGGDEFICVVPELLAPATELAEQARVRISVNPLASALGPVMLTCSLGVAEWLPSSSFDVALQIADKALYRAKKDGRNRVVSGHEPGTMTEPVLSLRSRAS
ncbi:MAG: diguanylate cyclase [Hyphomicrobiales bacterium]|nr:diguanylate cyclase [Hyphomicrobiales bacterium]